MSANNWYYYPTGTILVPRNPEGGGHESIHGEYGEWFMVRGYQGSEGDDLVVLVSLSERTGAWKRLFPGHYGTPDVGLHPHRPTIMRFMRPATPEEILPQQMAELYRDELDVLYHWGNREQWPDHLRKRFRRRRSIPKRELNGQ